jgi:cell shape-determining protein MreD
MDYDILAEFMASNGFWVSSLVVCLGVIFFVLIYGFWFQCILHAYHSDEKELKDKKLWLAVLVLSIFLPLIAPIIASAVYYSLYIRGK